MHVDTVDFYVNISGGDLENTIEGHACGLRGVAAADGTSPHTPLESLRTATDAWLLVRVGS